MKLFLRKLTRRSQDGHVVSSYGTHNSPPNTWNDSGKSESTGFASQSTYPSFSTGNFPPHAVQARGPINAYDEEFSPYSIQAGESAEAYDKVHPPVSTEEFLPYNIPNRESVSACKDVYEDVSMPRQVHLPTQEETPRWNIETHPLCATTKEMEMPPLIPVNTAPQYVVQIHEWIEACNELHEHACVPKPNHLKPPEDAPRWLIDTQQLCIVRGFHAERYLALSYVWPKAPQTSAPAPKTLLLDSNTISKLCTPGFLGLATTVEQVPNVIRHAIELTQRLGERYLWVDRMCIVQDDLKDGGTLSQVAAMDKIYAGAYLTIIAAASQWRYERGQLLRDWPLFKTSIYEVKPPDEGGYIFTPLDKDSVVKVLRKRYDDLSKSEWATRGWTYQEHILCLRSVMFLDNGVFWDCTQCVWDGAYLFPCPMSGSIPDDMPKRTDMAQRFTTTWWPDFGFYLDLICPFNHREFTYPQDAISGISGVLNALQPSFRGGFVYGLPRLFFDHVLLWQPFYVAKRRKDKVDDGRSFSSLPSWSWCGWQTPVDPWSLVSGLWYITNNGRASGWRTRKLVEWHILKNKVTTEAITEPKLLLQFTETTEARGYASPSGWNRQEVPKNKYRFGGQKYVFTHENDRSRFFNYPVPLGEALPTQDSATIQPYILCHTTSAQFRVATVLRCAGMDSIPIQHPPQLSAFEQNMFKYGPRDGGACPVLVLQQSNSAFAGLLRLMDEEPINPSTSIRLVAISTGEAKAIDIGYSFDWRVFEDGYYSYDTGRRTERLDYVYGQQHMTTEGRYALLFDIDMAFCPQAARAGPLGPQFHVMLGLIERILEKERGIHEPAEWPSGENFTSLRRRGIQFKKFSYPGLWYGIRSQLMKELRHGLREMLKEDEIGGRLWDAQTRQIYNPYGLSWKDLLYPTGAGVQRFDNQRSTKQRDPFARHYILSDDYEEKASTTYEFYNVLWIEQRGDISYRKACGWVPRHIWEAHARGLVQIKLG
jgi:hypothetical protein